MVTKMYVSPSLLGTYSSHETSLARDPLLHGHESFMYPQLTDSDQRFFFGGVVVSKSTFGMVKRIRPRSLLQTRRRRHQNQQTRPVNLRSGQRDHRGSSLLFFTVSCVELTASCLLHSAHLGMLTCSRLYGYERHIVQKCVRDYQRQRFCHIDPACDR